MPTADSRPSTRDNLVAAAIRLVAAHGTSGASIRQIARDAGVTEGTIYRHFRSKDELCREAFQGIIGSMIDEKADLLRSNLTTRERLWAWVRKTYEFFDRDPDAFTYVLLVPHDLTPKLRGVYHEQGRLFMDLIRRGQADGSLRPMEERFALLHFTALLLNVPRWINEGSLEPPASAYIDEVADAAWRVLGADPAPPAGG